MNFPINVAMRGECPLYILNLQSSYMRVVSNINRLTLQLQRSVSMRPTGPGQIPWVLEKVQWSLKILSIKYLSSLEIITEESSGISTV